MPDASLCPGCNQPKPKSWKLCKTCLEIYGGIADEWDAWLRERVNSARRWQYQEEQAYDHEIPLGDVEPYDGMDPDLDEPLWTRPRDEMAPVGPEALPYAPYEDEDMNRAYRKANGIDEIDEDGNRIPPQELPDDDPDDE
jgi:hypothetical protein